MALQSRVFPVAPFLQPDDVFASSQAPSHGAGVLRRRSVQGLGPAVCMDHRKDQRNPSASRFSLICEGLPSPFAPFLQPDHRIAHPLHDGNSLVSSVGWLVRSSRPGAASAALLEGNRGQRQESSRRRCLVKLARCPGWRGG